jgi:hypothetical protein
MSFPNITFFKSQFRRKKISGFLLAFGISLFSLSAKAQGCSDAGLCSFGSMNILGYKYTNIPLDKTKLTQQTVVDSSSIDFATKGDPNASIAHNENPQLKKDSISNPLMSWEFTSYYGAGVEENTSIFVQQLEGNFKLVNNKLFAQIKLPYSIISGKLGTTNGLSDVTMSLSYVALNKPKCNLSFAGGVKIPSNQSDLFKDNRPLPMVYQTSLGSTDILLGSRFAYKKWDFTVGYQHSFNANSNQYVHIPGINDSTTYNGYFESKNLRRADDGLFRINRKYQVKKTVLSTGLLFIYHMNNDDITNFSGERIKANGSQGLTLNFDVAGSIPITKKLDFTFVLAKPLVQRKYLPDGLARNFVGIVGLKRNF